MTPFQILFVCTGNICRSPLAERLLRARLHEAGAEVAQRYHVHSAGVGPLVDEPMDAQAAAALASLGGSAEGFLSRRITDAFVKEAGLVLTAEQRHRSRVLQDQPAAMRKTFTVREFAALCASLEGDVTGVGPAELVRRAAARRGSVMVADYDIPDPFRRTDAEHEAAAALARDAVDVIAPALVRAVSVSG
jgi:protein-tyrosine phosphatase